MKKIISRVLCIALIISMIIPRGISAKAEEEDYDRLNLSEIYAYETEETENGEDNPIKLITSDDEGHISYKRTHTKASTGVRYATKYLIMSAKPISFATTDITQNISPFEAKPTTPYVIVPFSKDVDNAEDDFGRIETTYYFENEELNDVAKRLGIDDSTDGKIDGFVEIYVTHVFEIAPANQSAWTSLKNAIGKISNSANSKPGNDNLAGAAAARAWRSFFTLRIVS